jgi:hypothetical protein
MHHHIINQFAISVSALQAQRSGAGASHYPHRFAK